ANRSAVGQRRRARRCARGVCDAPPFGGLIRLRVDDNHGGVSQREQTDDEEAAREEASDTTRRAHGVLSPATYPARVRTCSRPRSVAETLTSIFRNVRPSVRASGVKPSVYCSRRSCAVSLAIAAIPSGVRGKYARPPVSLHNRFSSPASSSSSAGGVPSRPIA